MKMAYSPLGDKDDFRGATACRQRRWEPIFLMVTLQTIRLTIVTHPWGLRAVPSGSGHFSSTLLPLKGRRLPSREQEMANEGRCWRREAEVTHR